MKKLPVGITIAAILTSQGAVAGALTIDPDNNSQYSQNEILNNHAGLIDKAISDSDKALSVANGIKDTADKALSKANDAAGAASTAASKAETAKEKADIADKNANQALINAKDADDKAKAAQNTATEANTRSQQNANNITAANDRITANSGRISALEISGLKGGQAYDMAVENKQAIKQEVQDRIDGDKQTLAASKAYTDSKYGQLSEAIEKNRKESFAGIAAALAASQVPQVTQGSYFSLGAGLGSYQGQNAVAVGMSARLGDNIVSKLTVTGDTQQRTGMGAGFSVEW